MYTDEGDLNGDGLADVVILATGRKKCMISEVHVLLRTPHNTLVPVVSDNLGCNSSLEVQTSTEVKSGNLFVTMAAWKGADTTYQFHWNNRFFELIGMRTHVVSGGLGDEPIFTADTDFNLRTGTALFKRRVYADRSPGELPPPADRRPTRVHAQGPKCALDKLTFEPLFCANDWKAGDTTVGDLMLIK
ncbi:hypothetical protein [Dyella sp. GSA-30]|uniref:hypothetical protein n=1 Tax=Dyella sp. GSA-30 TaxID=2994496 RepID=UPI0024932012|nr:hypothetical protein [Dyella sp. GSA-30]